MCSRHRYLRSDSTLSARGERTPSSSTLASSKEHPRAADPACTLEVDLGRGQLVDALAAEALAADAAAFELLPSLSPLRSSCVRRAGLGRAAM